MTQKVIEIIQSDKLYNINFTLKDANENAVDLTGGTLLFKAQKQTGTALAVNGSMTAGTPTAGMCYYTVQAADFTDSGDYYAEIEVTYSGSGMVITFSDLVIRVSPQLPRII